MDGQAATGLRGLDRALRAAGVAPAYVLLVENREGEGKRAWQRKWPDRRPTLAECERWLEGGPGYHVGLQPGPMGLLAFDVDDGDGPDAVATWCRERGAFVCSAPSTSGLAYKGHVFARVSVPVRNVDFRLEDPLDGLALGQLRCDRGQVRLNAGSMAALAAAAASGALTGRALTPEDLAPVLTGGAGRRAPSDFDTASGADLDEASCPDFVLARLREPTRPERHRELNFVVSTLAERGFSFDSVEDFIRPFVEAWPDGGTGEPDGKFAGEELRRHMALVWRAPDFEAVPRTSAADDFDAVTPDDAPTAEAPAEQPHAGSGTPMELARAMLRGKHYLRSNGDWLRYDAPANKYEEVPDEAFSAQTWSWVDKRPYVREGEVKTVTATRDVVANVVAAAVAQRQGPRAVPCWHPRREGDPDPADLLPVVNGLLHLPTMRLLPPSPRFVCRNASPVAYDPLAPAPTRWERFLDEVFPGDPETASTLQEVMGYLLTQDTSQQKIFCLIGPMRSGKGTINRVIQALVGPGNYSSPAINDLAQQFGLERLIGRQLATISDMRMGRNSDPSALAENLLRISGEDELSVNRKNKTAWEGRLNTRVVVISNETPQFRDTSGAIVSRFVLMQSTVSFLGREDTNLTRDLLAELPGTLNWCLAGLARLRARGHFVQPKASLDALATMDALASPVKAFAAQRLSDADREAETPKDEVWEAFYEWLEEAGLRYGGDRGHFFKDLGTVGLRFTSTRPRVNGERVQAVRGLSLVEPEGA
jgi:putative DNA primase/helicase